MTDTYNYSGIKPVAATIVPLGTPHTKEAVTQMAAAYVSSFLSRVGTGRECTIDAEDIIIDPKEANRRFLPRYKPDRKSSKSLRSMSRMRWKFEKRKIKEKSPHTIDGVAYIPLSDLNAEQRKFVEQVTGSTLVPSWVPILGTGYKALNGFGAEIGHVVGHKLYDGKLEDGIDELLDMISQIHELRFNLQNLAPGRTDIPELELALVSERVKERGKDIELVETLLYKDAAALETVLLAQGFKQNRLAFCVDTLKRSYSLAHHYEGGKLFLAAYDHAEGDVEELFRTIGTLLEDSEVTNAPQFLAALDVPDDEVSKFGRIAGGNIVLRSIRARKGIEAAEEHEEKERRLLEGLKSI